MNTWGFFRLWIVGTALFVMSVAFLSYADIKDEFDERTILQESKKNETVVPVLCGDARGVAGADYTNNQAVVGTRCRSSDPSILNTIICRTRNSRGSSMQIAVQTSAFLHLRNLGEQSGGRQASHSASRWWC
jgi:hypothetical protein